MKQEHETIAQIMARLTDAELIEMLPYIRNEDGEKVSLIELKHILREAIKCNLKHCASYNQVRKALKINGFGEKLARNLLQNQVTVK